jgi:ABC-type uncharacterized transport system permease subunit
MLARLWRMKVSSVKSSYLVIGGMTGLCTSLDFYFYAVPTILTFVLFIYNIATTITLVYTLYATHRDRGDEVNKMSYQISLVTMFTGLTAPFFIGYAA